MNTLEYYLSKGGAQGIIQRDAERRKNDRAERERLEEKQRQKELEEQQTKKAQNIETAIKMRAPWSPKTGTAAVRFRSEQAEKAQINKQRLIDTAKAVSKNPEEVKKTLTDLIPQDRQKAMYDKYRRKIDPAVKEATENSSAAYILGKTGLGTAESMQGITKLPNILSDAIQEGVPAITNMIKNPPSEKQKQYEYVVNNDGTVTMMKDIIEKQARQQAAKKYTESHSKKRSPADYTTDEAIEDLRNVLAEAEQKGSPAPKWIGDTAQAVGGMLPSILMNAALPGLGQAQMAGSVLGNTYDENRREGNDYVNSLLNAGANAGSELALESLLGVLGEGATAGISKLSPKLSKAIADNPKLQKIIASYPYRVIENAAGEGLEEAIQEPVSLMIDSATGKKATAEDLKQLPQNMLYSGAIGGLTGAGFGSVTNLGAAERPRLNLRKTNAAGELIQNNANVQNISGMSEMEPLQDKIRFEKSSVPNVERTGLTNENMNRFADNVDKVFKGELPKLSTVTIGQTPFILQKYGASDLPLTITQSAMYKIAYPQGYFGAEKQGHNLGIPALKQLPAQIADPAAILKSNTQDGSFVLLTEWNDTNNNPVIVPIHLDRQGNISLENRVTSAYGTGSEAIFGENNKNVLYTKENKSIEELRGYRLQLPVTPEDDTLISMNSIPQNQENSNSFSGNNGQEQDIRYDKSGANEAHTPEQLRIMAEYENAVDENMLHFIERVRNGENTKYEYKISKTNDKFNEEVRQQLGIDTTGFSHYFDPNAIQHIDKRHGESGEHDYSMKDIKDIQRIGYVLDNFDNLYESNELSNKFKNADNSPAKKIVLTKRVNGHYVVVEAVPDSQSKRTHIVSAYKIKADEVPHDFYKSLGLTSKNELHPTYNNTISQNGDEVKQEKIRADASEEARQRWTAENGNGTEQIHFKGSIGDIVKFAEQRLGIPISTGKMGLEGRGASGFYKTRTEAVRTRVANNLPTLAHEIGHHLDKKYKLSQFPHIQQAIDAMDADFRNKYSEAEVPGEAVAEFMRTYLRDRDAAREAMPELTGEFEISLPAKELHGIKKIGDMINAYMSADEAERLSRAIVSRTDKKTAGEAAARAKKFPTNAYINTVDDLHMFKLLDKAARNNGTDNVVGKNSSYTMAMNSRDSDARVENIVMKELRDMDGNKIDSGLADIVSEIQGKGRRAYDEFTEYLVCRHAMEWLAPDKGGDVKRVFGDDMLNDVDVMKRRAAAAEKANPEFKQTAEKLYAWQNKLMKAWLLDTGMITEEQYNSMKEKYPAYVPFYRKMAEGTQKNGGKKGFSGQNSGIRIAKGSGLEIYDPIESIVLNVDKFVKAASKNEAAKAAARLCDTTDGLGYFMERIPPEMAKKSVSVQGVKETLSETMESKGVSDAYSIIDSILDDTITQWEETGKQRDDVITVMDGGERKYYQVHDKRLLNALTAMDKQQLGGGLNFVQSLTRAFSSVTTGSNLLFMPSNAIRDLQTARVNTIAKNPAQFWGNYGKAIIEQLKNSEDYKLYKAMGGEYSSNLSQNMNILRRTMREISDVNPNMAKRFLNVALHPIESINTINDIVETAPRFGEFKTALRQGKDAHEAHFAAKDVTVNFQRHGAGTKELRAIIPFFNAGVQGLDKQARQLTGHFLSTILRIGTTTILPTLLAYALNNSDEERKKEYQRLSSYTKNNFYCFNMGDGQFLTLPKAREIALPASAIERTLEKQFGGNDEAFYDFGNYILSMLPGFGIEDIIGVGTVLNLGKNEDFKGSPIVPASMEDLEPRQQYDENTTWIAKTLGDRFNLSPKQIDYVINSNTGGIGQVNKAVGSRDKDWSLGLKNKFVRSSLYSTDVLNKLYDEKNAAMVDAKSHPEDAEKAYIYKRYTNAAKVTGELGRLAKNADNSDEAQNIKNMQLSYAEKARKTKNSAVDDAITELARETDAAEIFYTAPDNSVKYDKQTYTMPAEVYLKYAEECERRYYEECGKVLESYGNSDNDKKVKKLEAAKKKAKESVQNDMKNEIIQKGRAVFKQKKFQ